MNKKTKKIAIILITSIISISLVLLLILNVRVEKIDEGKVYNDIIPEEEITDNQLRETTLKLYYVGENEELNECLKKVDSKILVENPYLVAMQELLKKENCGEHKTYLPENVRINSITRNGECLIIDLSKEFIEGLSDDKKIQRICLSQIIKTMNQFTEINAVKILIDGSEENEKCDFKQLFTDEF